MPYTARQQQAITRHNSPAITVLTALAAITAISALMTSTAKQII